MRWARLVVVFNRLLARAGDAARRHPFAASAVVVFGVLLGFFLIVEVADLALLTDPGSALRRAGPGAAVLSVGLLSVDVVVPLPASLVMTLNGVLFGPITGAALSLLGGSLATVLAVAIGRSGGGLVARVVSVRRRARARQLLSRYGFLAVAVTRPVPLVAETTAVVAGLAGMSWSSALLAGAVGNLVPAAAYALAGSTAENPLSSFLVLGGVLLLSGAMWLVGRAGLRGRDYS